MLRKKLLLILRLQVGSIIEKNMEKGLQNYGIEEYKGVTETWNIVQHEVEIKSFFFGQLLIKIFS